MLDKTNILLDENVYLFDKKTGEKFLRQSNIMFCQISHYTLKSEISGETILLSVDGIKRRFSKNPNSSGKYIKKFIKNLSKLR
jgi:hypothetical protein